MTCCGGSVQSLDNVMGFRETNKVLVVKYADVIRRFVILDSGSGKKAWTCSNGSDRDKVHIVKEEDWIRFDCFRSSRHRF